MSENLVLCIDADKSQNYQPFYFHIRGLQPLAKLTAEELVVQ
jgi:hypothetical protein